MTDTERAILAAARAFEQVYAASYEGKCRPDRAAMAAAASRLVKAVRAHKDSGTEAPES